MPYNGTNGTYSLPAGNPVVSGTTISSSVMNNTMTDIAAALSSVLVRDGEAAMTGTLNMGGQAISNAAGFTASGTINVGSVNVTSSTVPANGEYLPAANTWGVTTNSTQRFTINATGNLVVAAPTAGVALTVNGFAGANIAAITVQGSTTAGQSNGVITLAGYNSADRSIDVLNALGTIRLFGVFGDGHFSLGYNGSTAVMTGSASGAVTINAPTSGNALTVNGLYATTPFTVQSANTTNVASDIYVTRPGSTANAFAQGPSIQLNDTANTGQTIFQQSGGQTELWQYNGAWAQIFKVTTGRAVVINAPSTGNSLTINTASGYAALSFPSGGTQGSANVSLGAKPGSNAGNPQWILVSVAGAAYWIPAWSN